MNVHSPVTRLRHLDDWTASDTEPSETFAGMLWLDTSSDPHVLKRRNDADDGWVTVGGADSAVWMPLTTVMSGEPVLVWDDDNSLVPTKVPT